MNAFYTYLAALVFCLGLPPVGCLPASAGTLQVEPVLIAVAAPGGASSIKLRNPGPGAVEAQVRVFRWLQVNGEERLEPTQEVVASPPALSIGPNATYVVRVVRVQKGPVTREESYRLVVDQLPSRTQQSTGTVNMILRQSLPVFFSPQSASGPAVSWSVKTVAGRLQVLAHNKGDRRLRIAALRVAHANGTSVSFGSGLVGYALAGSTMRWSAPLGSRPLGQGALLISAQGDSGPIHAAATTTPGN